MKRYFATGVVILLPLTLTVMVLAFTFNLLTDPFVGIFNRLLDRLHLLEDGFLLLSATEVRRYVSQILVIVFFVAFTTLLGRLARLYFFGSLLKVWDFILHRTPVVGTIYKTIQEVIKTLFTTKEGSFKQVVQVPFPNEDSQALGLVAKENMPPIGSSNEDMVGVFVPTALNPTSGYFLLYPKSQVVYLNMKVDEAFKYLISCGAVKTPFNSKPMPENLVP